MNVEERALPALPLPALAAPSWAADLLTLTKARLMTLVMVTTFVGFWMHAPADVDWALLLRALFGTALVAAASAVLNQYVEADVDRLMARTRERPLPAARMRPSTALGLGVLLGVAGTIYLFGRVNAFAAGLAALTLFVYVLLYTPLKRRTSFCVTVGAISGALPPLIGWTAAQASLGAGGWILFGVLFLWQIPHFLAIAWMYRDEYAQAGFVMLRRNDPRGVKTAVESLICVLLLLAITLLPLPLGLVAGWYLPVALLFNGAFLWLAVGFLQHRCRNSARRLFFASIAYLPAILGLLVFAKRGL